MPGGPRGSFRWGPNRRPSRVSLFTQLHLRKDEAPPTVDLPRLRFSLLSLFDRCPFDRPEAAASWSARFPRENPPANSAAITGRGIASSGRVARLVGIEPSLVKSARPCRCRTSAEATVRTRIRLRDETSPEELTRFRSHGSVGDRSKRRPAPCRPSLRPEDPFGKTRARRSISLR